MKRRGVLPLTLSLLLVLGAGSLLADRRFGIKPTRRETGSPNFKASMNCKRAPTPTRGSRT
jgi:hypothetical protein